MRLVRSIVFPEYYPNRMYSEQILRGLLYSQLSTVLCSDCNGASDDCIGRIADAFVSSLPEIKRLLLTDVQAALHNDPAVTDAAEVILCYPFVTAMLHHRTAHCLLRLGVPQLPRMLSEMAHSETGLDIQSIFEDIGIRGGDEHALLFLRHGDVGVAVFVGLTRLYLNDDQELAVFCDDVNLLVDVAPVALQYLITLTNQIVDGELLAQFAEIDVFCHIVFCPSISAHRFQPSHIPTLE